MNPQLALDGLTEAPKLTERQEQAYALIRQRGPIRSEDLGAELYPRVHELDRARTYGRAVGDALAEKGLVVFVRGEGWVLAEEASERKACSQTTEIPY